MRWIMNKMQKLDSILLSDTVLIVVCCFFLISQCGCSLIDDNVVLSASKEEVLVDDFENKNDYVITHDNDKENEIQSDSLDDYNKFRYDEFMNEELPQYDGEAYVEVNDNQPFFLSTDMKEDVFETYSTLDSLGRCGVAYANICKDLMPTEPRGEIGAIRPSGWKTVKYNGIVEGNYLYNRCHLIGYQLAGENANENNLITGTRYMNVQGMLPFENEVVDYVNRTGNHVLYRVTPMFEADNLVANGVLMEAKSVEDHGKGLCYNVYVFNVQPGVVIDYSNGESYLLEDWSSENNQNAHEYKEQDSMVGSDDVSVTAIKIESNSEINHDKDHSSEMDNKESCQFVVNTNTRKFHYPNCNSVNQIKEKNRKDYEGMREDLISQGYKPCQNCNP